MGSCFPRPYPSDLTDEQWALIEPMVPVKPGGRPAKHPRRGIVEAILYLDRTDAPGGRCRTTSRPGTPSTGTSSAGTCQGTDRIHDALRAAVRHGAGRDPLASAGIVDSQSVTGADTVGADSRGY
ncbi:transposase [Citricoccus nitrophenolicus]|uniref:transposase n=1 Tax=Citricoccus nitrophenolicus TaxID=863575 RepID=UPI0033849642